MTERTVYVLVRPRGEGCIHACIPFLGQNEMGDAVCGRSVGDRWTVVRSYRHRGVTRMRVTCNRCRAALCLDDRRAA